MSDSSSGFSRALNPARTSPAVVTWLIVLCVMIFVMVLIGGITRLTGSGLSMVDWKPIAGVIPPLNDAAWLAEFARYQQSPEFQQVNFTMDVDGFKRIFLMEWAHRVFGRLIGIVFAIPFLFFLITRRINGRWLMPLVGIFILGGLQGLLGWYMVKSGLVDNPQVSQYRLSAHLTLAVALYAALLWTTLTMSRGRTVFVKSRQGSGVFFAGLIVFLVGLMIVTGGFMAGTKAGHVHNTFPMIDGAWIPANTFAMSPLWKNFFENVTTIQVVHRYLAMFTCLLIAIFCLTHIRVTLSVVFLGLVMLAQFTLGVLTLVAGAPVHLALMHQCMGLMLLTAAIITLHRVRH